MGHGHFRLCVSITFVKTADFSADVRSFTAGAIIIAASYSVPQIIVGRLVLGVGVGGAAVIAPLYIAELAPTAVRGRCVGVNAFCIPFGQVIASAIGAGFQAGVPYHIGWRVLCEQTLALILRLS